MYRDPSEEFISLVREKFNDMCKSNRILFTTEVDGGALWDAYLDAIPAEENPIYRKRRVYDCSACRQFIIRAGSIVAINDGELISIWDIETDSFFKEVAMRLSNIVKTASISSVFLTAFPRIGIEESHERTDDKRIITYKHLSVDAPEKFVKTVGREHDLAEYKTTKEVFKRSLEEISIEAVDVVLELIDQKSLYRGEEWRPVAVEFKALKTAYDCLTDEIFKDRFAWEKSVEVGTVIGRIKNHSLGTLLTDITDGMSIDAALTKWEQIMAPANYRRPQAVFTQKMLEEAKAEIQSLGYLDSLPRRFATLNDIRINNTLFSNKDVSRRISGGVIAEDFFADVSKAAINNPKKFNRVQQISIEDFIEKILPTAKGLEVYFENKHASNMVSLIAPINNDAPSLFKWNNKFNWAYTGNLADSDMKKRVKAAGGRVDGVLRFSIQWNDSDGNNNNDEDAHCIEPDGREIYFGKAVSNRTGGNLDVDIMQPRGKVAVENITWPSLDRMTPGKYSFYVHTYAGRGGRGGFRAEVEADGIVHTYDYPHDTRSGGIVRVADVILGKDGSFTINDCIPSGVSTNSKEVWGICTNQFVPVSVMCYSPNWWDQHNGIGNKHYFFMLKDCINDESPNGFYNEQLKPELKEHKRVLEALGSRAHVQDTPDQLSGLGFSSTKHAELVVKVQGATERILKIII